MLSEKEREKKTNSKKKPERKDDDEEEEVAAYSLASVRLNALDAFACALFPDVGFK